MFTRQKQMVAAAVGSALVATLALGPSVASADPIDVTGDASGLTVTVTVAGVPVTLGPTPTAATPPGGSQTNLNQAAPEAQTSASVLTATSQGSSTGVTSLAQVIGANALAGTLTAGVITATCTSTASGSTGSSNLAGGQAAGTPLNVSPPPNQTIPLPLLGTLFLNEQIRSDSPGRTSMTVNAVRLALTGGVVTGGILISHAACAAVGPDVGVATSTSPANAVPSDPSFLAG